MPRELQMSEEESKDITFGGRMVVYPDNVDATSAPMELDYLKFE
ncbi:hypothetical protein [Sphingobacterium alkalisoli]|nr:hypothetical protein [Sphingobacterium alkalisoli]